MLKIKFECKRLDVGAQLFNVYPFGADEESKETRIKKVAEARMSIERGQEQMKAFRIILKNAFRKEKKVKK